MRSLRLRNVALAVALGLTVVLSGNVSPAAAASVTTGSDATSFHALPYGPDTCIQGFVWREAIPSDHVCVTPDTRSQTWYDNSQAGARRDVFGAYGSDTCIQGFVWREAFAGDRVCVTPDTRAKARYDNSVAAYRRAHE